MSGQIRSLLSSRPAIAVAAFLVGGLLVGGSYAWASIPNASGAIQGCYKNTTPHTLQVIDTAKTAKCPTGTTALAWNQTGPKGDSGTSLNKVTTVVASATVPSYYDPSKSSNGFKIVATAAITVTGSGPHLIQVSWSYSSVTLPPLPFSTPCGPYDSSTGPGTFYLVDSDGAPLATPNAEIVPGPGTYTYEVAFGPNGCFNPVIGQGVASYTTGPVGLSVIQM